MSTRTPRCMPISGPMIGCRARPIRQHPYPDPKVIPGSFPLTGCSQCRSMQDMHLQHSIAVSADISHDRESPNQENIFPSSARMGYDNSQASPSPTIPEFHQFSLLPREIQSEIWSFAALQPRTIPLLTHWTPPCFPPGDPKASLPASPFDAWTISITPLCRIPPLLHACSASREVALPNYYLVGTDPRRLALEGDDDLPSNQDFEIDDDQDYEDYDDLPFDQDFEGTRGFYINPSIDVLYFTPHLETHNLEFHTLQNEDGSTRLEEDCAFCDHLQFPIDRALRMFIGCCEVRKLIRHLAFNIELPGIGHKLLWRELELDAGTFWAGLENLFFCLEGEGGIDDIFKKNKLSNDIKGKGKETSAKEWHSIPKAVDLEKELKLYSIRESFTGPSAGKGNALFKKCMSKFSLIFPASNYQPESWEECYKPSGSLDVDGRPAIMGTGFLKGNRSSEGEIFWLPVLRFGVVRNFEEESKCVGLDEDPFAVGCFDRYASCGMGGYAERGMDEANDHSAFGFSVVMSGQ